MAEVLPHMYGKVGHMEQGKNAVGMPLYQHWAPPDEKDAYIGWIRSEFAAANAIIDSMCHHLRTIGSPGQYDNVFGCLSRRRQAWTPSLYMQQFYSVAEIVNSLQEAAWQKHQVQRAVAMASYSVPKECPSSNGIREDENHHKGVQNSTSKLLQSYESIDLRKQADGCPSKTAEVQASKAPCNGALSYDGCLSPSKTAEVQASKAPCNGALSYGEEGDMKQANACMETSSTTSKECYKSMSVNDKSRELTCQQSRPIATKGTIVDKLLNIGVSLALEKEDARVAAIKRSLQFQCCERVNGKMINDGESAELCENVFSDEEIKAMAEVVCQFQSAGRQGDLGCAFRSCKTSGCGPDVIQFGQGVQANRYQRMPVFVRAMVKWLTRCGILSATKKPDSCLISIFDEGDFDPPNTGHVSWEKPLCIISVFGDSTMVFGHSISADQQGVCKGLNQVTVPAGSVLLLQETFAGILQKAVSTSSSRRITIALGKAASMNGIMELKCAHAEGQVTKDKNWAAAADGQNGHPLCVNDETMKQGRLTPNAGVIPLHPLPPMPHLMAQRPFPSIQPIFPTTNGGLINPSMPHPAMAPQVWAGTPAPPKLHNTGTGVFFPACNLNGGVPAPSWQSGLLVLSSFSRNHGSLITSTTGLEIRRSRRADKLAGQAKAKVSFNTMEMKLPKKKPGKHVSGTEPGQSMVVREYGEAASIKTS